MTAVADMVGFPCEPAKDADDAAKMVVLGAEVAVLMARSRVSVAISEELAIKYAGVFLDILTKKKCTRVTAVKMAGRLSFAVSVTAGRVGRAYLKPFFAQANEPQPRERASWSMLRAAAWFARYLGQAPAITHSAGSDGKPHVHAWTDAAGAEQWLSAVCVHGSWLWTRLRVPDEVWQQLLPRGDNQIGMQELLAVPLAYTTFADEMQGALWTLSVDNQGVLHAILKGCAVAEDMNYAVAQVWLGIAAQDISVHLLRVESRANIADGPTRGHFYELAKRGAQYREPRMPQWVRELWQGPSIRGLDETLLRER